MNFDRPRLFTALFFGSKVRESVYGKLAAMIGHGVGLKSALELLQDRYTRRRHPLAVVFRDILSRLMEGDSLADALSPFVPGEESMLIKSGLDSGDLPAALERCASLLQARRSIVSGVIEALSYPALLLVLLVAVLLVLSRYVVPQLAQISNPELWQGGARALYQVAMFADSPAGLSLLALLMVGLCVSLLTLPHFTGPVRKVCDLVPPWSFYRLIVGSIWLFTVAAMMRSGIQVASALTEMADQPGTSRWLAERVRAINAGLDAGSNFGTALQDAGHDFPDRELVEDILIYSSLPGFDERLQRIAEQWLAEGKRKIAAEAKVINLACLMGILVLMLGVGLAISSLQQQLGQGLAY